MPKVRIDSELKQKMKDYIENSSTWSKQSEFVNHAVRELLKKEEGGLTEQEKESIREFVKELEDSS